jgi:2-oxoglutarate dehydrogenase E2 component (dihydrolipoamide succinyltransferase)
VSHEVTLPVLGESVSEGTVSRWLKKVGDTVARDEPLVEISTDKVDTEIPSPVAGVLAEIRIHEDETATVGAVLAVVNASESQEPLVETPVEPPADRVADVVAEPTPADVPEEPSAPSAADSFKIPSFVPPPTPEPTASQPSPSTAEPLQASNQTPSDPSAPPPPPPSSGTDATGLNITPSSYVPAVAAHEVADTIGSGAYVTPLVRRLAEEKGVDLARVQGSGVGGRIRKQDILAAASDPSLVRAQVVDVVAPEASTPQLAMTEAAPQVEPMPSDAEVTTTKGKSTTENKDADAPIEVAEVIEDSDLLEETAALLEEDDYEPTVGKAKAPVRTRKTRAKVVEPEPELLFDDEGEYEDDEPERVGKTEKLTRARVIIANRMVDSLQSSAQLTATVEVDLTLIARLRRRVKDEFQTRKGVSLTFLPFIAKAALEALKAYPKINASIDLDAKEIIYPDGEHLGIAVDTTKGLLVPVIRSAGDLTVSGLAKKIADVSARARSNKIKADELTGGTFTITNYGSVGTLFDTPIVNQPQVAILGAGAIRRRPVAVDDARLGEIVAIRDIMYLSLSYDHRLVDGADAARFLVMVKDRLEAGDFGAEF